MSSTLVSFISSYISQGTLKTQMVAGKGDPPGQIAMWGMFVFFCPAPRLPLFKVYSIPSYHLQNPKERPAIHWISVPQARYKRKKEKKLKS